MLKKSVLWVGLLVLVTVVNPPSASADDGSDPTIQGCYLRRDGSLRIVASPDECRRNEVFITWNIVGPQGPAGPAGEPGTVEAPLVLNGFLPDAAVIAGVNTLATTDNSPLAGSKGVYGTGFTGIVGEGNQYGVAGFTIARGSTGVLGEGYIFGVEGKAVASASTGGAFTSIGAGGTGVSGTSTALGIPGTGVSGVGFGTGVSGVASEYPQGRLGTGVKGEGYLGLWGRGRSTFTPDTETGPVVQGAGVRGEGYYGIYGTSETGYAGYFDGAVQVNGILTATTLLQNSDRQRKANVAPVDGHAILRRLATLPVQTWNYQDEPIAIRHIGPMAQDFYTAFAVGVDDRHIATVDEGGVALAAIQTLYTLSLEKDARIDELTSELRALKAEVELMRRLK